MLSTLHYVDLKEVLEALARPRSGGDGMNMPATFYSAFMYIVHLLVVVALSVPVSPVTAGALMSARSDCLHRQRALHRCHVLSHPPRCAARPALARRPLRRAGERQRKG